MSAMVVRLRTRFGSSSGQGMAEYSVIGAAIVVAAYLTFRTVGTDVNNLINSILVAF